MPIKKTAEGLERVIGVPGLALTIVNNTIGAGIFALPAIVSMQLGAFGIFAYIIGSLLMATIMLCYMEIGTRVTSSGGSYAYVEAAFGNFAGFVINWLYFFGWGVLGSAAVINIFADSLSVLFPVLTNSLVRALLFFVVLGAIVLLNIRGTKQSVQFLKVISIIKLLPLFAIIIFGFNHIKPSNLHLQNLPPLKTFADTVLVLIFAIAGFESSLSVSGEIKNSRRTVPLGILLGGVLVFITYMLIQTVTQGVLGAQISAVNDAPLAAVAEQIIGPVGATVLLLAAAISCFGLNSGDILSTPRLLFAGANDGLFPKFLAKVHPKFATPYAAIITYASLIFIFSVSGSFKQLAILASASILLIYLSVILATIKMRTKKREVAEKTFRIPGGLIIPFIGIAAIIWLLTSLGKWEILSTVIFIALVCVIYFVMKKVKKEKIRIELAEEIL
jgi:APA family basic amino acid/polyamine antiporter